MFSTPIKYFSSTTTLPSGTTYTDIGTEIEKYVAENIETTAGMEVSIFHENDTIYQNYFGYVDKEKQIATEENTVMEWGSATKILVWVSPYGVETIDHGGNSTGCSSYLLLDIENKISVVIMTNQTYEMENEI